MRVNSWQATADLPSLLFRRVFMAHNATSSPDVLVAHFPRESVVNLTDLSA